MAVWTFACRTHLFGANIFTKSEECLHLLLCMMRVRITGTTAESSRYQQPGCRSGAGAMGQLILPRTFKTFEVSWFNPYLQMGMLFTAASNQLIFRDAYSKASRICVRPVSGRDPPISTKLCMCFCRLSSFVQATSIYLWPRGFNSSLLLLWSTI